MAENTHDILREVVDQAKCKPGWTFSLVDEEGALRLVILVPGFDSATPSQPRPFNVRHFFPVPMATFNKKSWTRWIFEMCRRVENHELGEWFRLGAERPFEPLRGPGEDPYTVHEFRSITDALTTRREPYGE